MKLHRRFFSRKKRWFFVCVFLALGLYFPHLLYIAFKLGILGNPTIGNASVQMKTGWFPVASSDTKLGKLMLGQPSEDMVAYAHITKAIPGVDKWVVFDTRHLTLKHDPQWKLRSVLRTETLPWGRAYIIKPDIIKATGPDFAVFESFDLTATSKDAATLVESLAGISSIQTRNVRSPLK